MDVSTYGQKLLETKNKDSRLREFNPKVNYNHFLNLLKTDFETKWGIFHFSESVGLEGYITVAQLGAGSFGKVFLVKEIIDENYYAVKMMSKDHIVQRNQVTHILNEKKILSCINFPNVIKLIFSSKDNDFLYLGMNFVAGGDLFVRHRIVGRFAENEACFYAAQVFLALEYLHNVQVGYRDLKPENICFEINGYITLTDFGFAKRIPSRTTTLCGTPEYLAPEIITSTPYGLSVDWWAFGILIYEFVNGSSPFSVYFSQAGNMAMYEKIMQGSFNVPNYFSNSLKNLISHLLCTEVTQRLGTIHRNEIKTHAWFKDVDWYGMLNQNLPVPYKPVKRTGTLTKMSQDNKSRVCRYEKLFVDF